MNSYAPNTLFYQIFTFHNCFKFTFKKIKYYTGYQAPYLPLSTLLFTFLQRINLHHERFYTFALYL